MRRGRLLLAVAALAVAAFAAVLASDLRAWSEAVAAGDRTFAVHPAQARWNPATALPAGLSRDLLGISDDLAYRHAVQAFVAVQRAGCGVDNCYSESLARTSLELRLANLARSADRVRSSTLYNLLGILAFADSQQRGASRPAPVERSVADFQAAVQLDPTNEDAKFNLEWLLRRLAARGVRPGGTSGQSGPARGHKGAAGGVPGRGF
jgi:hypothetical protein